MNVISQLAGSTEFELDRAILLYRGTQGRGSLTIATLHTVETGADGVPRLNPGSCVKADAAHDLALQLLQQSGQLEMLPATVLAMSVKGLAWHCPPAVRQLWFNPAAKDDHGQALKALTGEHFPQPHLLFLASGHGLQLFALKGKARPTAKSPLFQAPYYNVNTNGDLCIGSARIPDVVTPALVGQAERAFFESNFTHSNAHDGKLTLHQGGHLGLWRSLRGKRRFPEETLVPLRHGRRRLTLGDVL